MTVVHDSFIYIHTYTHTHTHTHDRERERLIDMCGKMLGAITLAA